MIDSWLRAARASAGLFAQAVAAFAVACIAVFWNAHGGVRWFALGVYFVAVLWILTWVLSLLTGTGWQVRGILAERWTAAVLAPRRARKQGWRLVHGLYFAGHGDVDHVLIGPAGVWAVETKWVSEPAGIEDDRLVGLGVTVTAGSGLGDADRCAQRLTKARVAVQPRPLVVLARAPSDGQHGWAV